MVPLLRILQLASPALPVGAYSYSEGIEWLCDAKVITNAVTLESWLEQELSQGSIRIDGAVLLRIYQAILVKEYDRVKYWNEWISAQRETDELRKQSWQMGNSLYKLIVDITPELTCQTIGLSECNFVTAFALGALSWGIPINEALTAYISSWLTNLISAGVRLIPLGQTIGQKITWQFHSKIEEVVSEILLLTDEEIECCTIGLSLASMRHEMQYSRLFRS